MTTTKSSVEVNNEKRKKTTKGTIEVETVRSEKKWKETCSGDMK